MKMFRALTAFVVFFALALPAAAQWQTPNHSVPMGRGVGVMGYGSVAPGVSGLPFVSNGAGVDPSYQALGTGGIAANAVSYAKMQTVTAGRLLGNSSGSPAVPAEISVGTGLSMTGGVLSNGYVAPAALGGAIGLVITNNATTPNSIVDIAADQAIMLATSTPIYAAGVAISVNTSVVGVANGLDAGSRAASTWYNLFLISNGTTTAGLASLSATAPTMPSGYTYAVRVGAMRTDGSGNFLRTKQLGNRAQYTIVGSSNTTIYPAIVSNSAPGIVSYAAISVANFVPPTATQLFYLMVNGTVSGTVAVAPNTNFAPTAINSASFSIVNSGAAGSSQTSGSLILESSSIGYASNSASMAVLTLGWTDKVNAS